MIVLTPLSPPFIKEYPEWILYVPIIANRYLFRRDIELGVNMGNEQSAAKGANL